MTYVKRGPNEPVPYDSDLTVGIVGTGEIGGAMVERMRDVSVPVVAFARRPEARDHLASIGVDLVDSLADLGSRCDIVIVCVFTDAQVSEVALDGLLASMRPGSVLVSHTTGSPSTYERLAAAAPNGVHIVDAPVSGAPSAARAGNITLLVGGDDDAVARITPVLDTYASPVIHAGPLGRGQQVKLINNLLFAANVQVAVAAAHLGEGFGFEPAPLATILGVCSGASFATGLISAMGSLDTLVSGLGPFLGKDIAVVEAVSAELGLDLGILGDVVRNGPFGR
ncbi:MAG: NAD(P)-dependent oxidoreductase [Acidimicrobiia bacterium]